MAAGAAVPQAFISRKIAIRAGPRKGEMQLPYQYLSYDHPNQRGMSGTNIEPA
ncbi:hypothetical protein SAMN05216228_100755 [Rhizobium tibeticum]|uniref:Uncharacterized protein n=1 Tax=Rhizobium tibeticum TaxID=501024 RepID=A0A1H8J0I1_9HYPH|nr:hypothetical protein RTCCBAU85039_2061 [Rhizobium tibeticum]SEN74383.1 hypothetical protein SAMN05216228_100755 [Rhizobium tibeticum]